ncbi:MAG: hypothetical protein UR26_C0001G0074 [candidate division TM6 bacterium GW2011_GWF2_32_72]|nr:MAG: hypothetical protein UR26_C0001G0074 [candidate division TM6 bacterium GW2011_GWF2_32_72]
MLIKIIRNSVLVFIVGCSPLFGFTEDNSGLVQTEFFRAKSCNGLKNKENLGYSLVDKQVSRRDYLGNKKLTLGESQKLIFDLLKKNNSSSLDAEALNDSGVFFNSTNQGSGFIKALDCMSKLGFICLANKLAEPISDIKKLKMRQLFVKALVENEVLFNSLNENLVLAAANEQGIIELWSAVDPIKNRLLRNEYFGKRFSGANSSSMAMELKFRLKHLKAPLIAGSPWIVGIIAGLAAKKILPSEQGIFLKLFFGKDLTTIKGSSEYVSEYMVTGWPKEVKDLKNLNILNAIPHIMEKGTRVGVVAAWAWLTLSSLNSDKKRMDAVVAAQEQMIELARFTEAAKGLAKTIEEVSLIEAFDGFDSSFIKKYSEITVELKELLEELGSLTFKGWASYFSRAGKVLVVYKKAMVLRDQLIPMMEFVGEVDTCVAVVKMIKKHQNSERQFTFVDVNQAPTPFMSFSNCWNPFDKDDKSLSSAQLGGDSVCGQARSSGSEASINCTAVTRALMLAQSYGVAPASSFAFTPFTRIIPSLHLNTVGMSAEVAEQKRVEKINKKAFENSTGFTFIGSDNFSDNVGYDLAQANLNSLKSVLSNRQTNICLLSSKHALNF